MTNPKIGSREEWQAARDELLGREKEHTRMGDELARQRRELPWVAVEKANAGYEWVWSAAAAAVLDGHRYATSGQDSVKIPRHCPDYAPGQDGLTETVRALILYPAAVDVRRHQRAPATSTSTSARADGTVYHPYSTRAPKGRDESGSSEFWIRRHDELLGSHSPRPETRVRPSTGFKSCSQGYCLIS
jgi:hypothetical protein